MITHIRSHIGKYILILSGAISWLIPMVKSGMPIAGGIGYWGPNGHDGIWHIALIESLSRGSFDMPTFAGVQLQNYHIGFDLFVAVLHIITRIPVSLLYFQVIPICLAFGIGMLVWHVVYEWKNSKQAAWWSTFFVYFGGSFGWIVTLARGQGVSGESMFWSQQGVSTLINPPFAFSLIFLLSGIFCLLRMQKTKKQLMYTLLAIACFGVLIEIKAYAGVLALGSLFVIGIWNFLRHKKSNVAVIFVGSMIVSVLLFIPLNHSSSSLIVFQPGWFLETMLALSDRFSWPKLYEALMNWRSGQVYAKAVIGYLVALVIFLAGNFGLRIIGLVELKNFYKSRNVDVIHLFMLSVLGGGILAPLLFVQQGTAWNTIQFLYYSLFIASLYAGMGFASYISTVRRPNVRITLSIIVVLLTLPTTLSTLHQVYVPNRPPAMLSNAELEALAFLKKQDQGTVLTYPFDKAKADAAVVNPPRPLYLYESTAYVAAFSGKPVFLEDEVNLTIMSYPWKDRRALVDSFYKSGDHSYTKEFLKTNKIRYIYWIQPQQAVLGDKQLELTNIFENKEVVIYKTKY